jgi:hypothetical protein
MVAVLTPADRMAFKTCRRAWDLAARERRNLEPIAGIGSLDVDRAIRDALAVYYFPGMWDWARAVVVPLVGQALDKALADQRARLGPGLPPGFDRQARATRQLLAAYVEWAPGIERLAPVLVEVAYAANLSDPQRADSALFTSSGEHVSYQGRLDLLGVDEHDAYWIMRHRVVREWTPLGTLMRDEEAVAACWAWQEYYIGMEIAGTIHNEMRLPTVVPPGGDRARPARCRSARAAAADVPSPSTGAWTPAPRNRRSRRPWRTTPVRGSAAHGSGGPRPRSARRAASWPPRPARSSTPRWRSSPPRRSRPAAVARSPRRVWPSTREGIPRPRPS